MLYSEIARVLGKYFLYFTAVLLLPLGISILYEFFLEQEIYPHFPATVAFLKTMGVCLALSLLMTYFGRTKKGALYRKESILLVILIWFFSASIGALPFLLTKTISNPIDAYFESMSGLTTTGATIIYPKSYDPLTGKEIPITLNPGASYTFYGTVAPIKTETGVLQGIEALGKPLLFWRSFLQWLGGIGIVVLFITILPTLGMGGKFLYENEVSGPTKEGIAPRIKETAAFLLKVYLGLTLLQIALLMLTDFKMPLFDAVTLSFSTLSTGGFTIYNNGLARYNLSSTRCVIALFMILGAFNFSLYFHCLKKKINRFSDRELLFYFLILILGSLCVSASLWMIPSSVFKAFFQAISAQTSTGFSIVNYNYWPLTSQLLLIGLMFIGGMSGSTAGGIKVIRIMILFRVIFYKIESFFRPEAVRVIKIGHKEIAEKTAMTVFAFFGILIFLVAGGVFLLILDNNDLMTSLGVISTTITNTGLTFGGIGDSSESLGFLSNSSKVVSIFWMLLGRLEFFSLLILLFPAYWRK